MAKDDISGSEKTAVEVCARESVQEYLSARTLESACPILKQYLGPESRVLDVGCGPGSITLEVAKVVESGSVVGIDPSEEALGEARRAAGDAGPRNLDYRVGDSYSIDFADGSFDLVYSNQVLPYLENPAEALREQARVTRSGGWVVAMICSLEDILLHPECHALRKIVTAFRAHREPEATFFYNAFAPHEVVGNLVDAGLLRHRIVGFVPDLEVAYPGSRYFEYRYEALLKIAGGPWLENSREFLMRKRLIDDAVIENARSEVEAWHDAPQALYMQPVVAACAQVD